ncbi:MAG: DUF5610 domain-containing protein [Methylococcales bacterium]|jgi:hypothetical protein|nr:DUF5610 domain-containing protein [Methylococcales bacterium]MBT7408322.1 DUF5610 domain-containing protein [Methylococcales bacterium]
MSMEINTPHLDVNQMSHNKLKIDSYKAELNQQIISASVDVSISSGSQPMSLLFKSVETEMQSAIKAELENAPVEGAKKSLDIAEEDDYSPEATAGRIVEMATAFFPAYKEQHPELDDETALDRFMEVIGKGIDTGFEDAKKILGGLEEFKGEVADNVDKTYDLVQNGLTDFREKMLEALLIDKDKDEV